MYHLPRVCRTLVPRDPYTWNWSTACFGRPAMMSLLDTCMLLNAARCLVFCVTYLQQSLSCFTVQ